MPADAKEEQLQIAAKIQMMGWAERKNVATFSCVPTLRMGKSGSSQRLLKAEKDWETQAVFADKR